MTDWLGQNGEDRIVAEWLAAHRPGLVGCVLDLGAHDGRTFSNTGKLLDAGWGGTLVECSPKPLGALLDRYGERENIRVVGACVEVTEPHVGLTMLSDSNGDCVSTTTERNRRVWGQFVKFRRLFVPVLSIDRLIYACPGPYHVLSIDLEGQSVDVFRALRIAQWTELAVCVVEFDDKRDAALEHAANAGFRLHAENGENVILVRP